MEKYTPVKELPEEITALPQGDTVCSYCGVSYLIHHEIKRLEQELKEYLEKSQLLENEKLIWRKQTQDLELTLSCKEEELGVVKEEVVSVNAKMNSLQNEYRELEIQKDKLDSYVTNLRSERVQVFHNTQILLNEVNELKGFCDKLNKMLKVEVSEVGTMFLQLSSRWSLCQQQSQQEIESLKKEVAELEKRKEAETKNFEDLSHQWKSTKEELSQQVHYYKESLEKVKETLSETESKYNSLLNENKSLDQKVRSLSEALRFQEIQSVQIRAEGQRKLSAISTESDRLARDSGRRIDELKNTVASLSSALGDKEMQVKNLKEALSLKEKEVNNFMGQSEKRCKQLEEQLRKTKENHESQISELKLLCDHRIAVLDKRFAEKEQELETSYATISAENQDTITKLKSSLTVAELRCKRMAESLQEELNKEKSLCDQEMIRHIQQVKELEVKLVDLQKEKDEAIKREALKLEATKQTLFDLDRKLTIAYEEISKLQAVVQRQCEERQLLLKSVPK